MDQPHELINLELTNLSQIQVQSDSDCESGSEQGEMSTSRLSLLNPLYKEIGASKEDQFYLGFFNCIEEMNGEEKERYDKMKERFKKFFIEKDGIGQGERWSKRIEPSYNSPQTYPLSFAVMIYGVDYMSNRDLKKLLKLDVKTFKGIMRINWSNVAIIFSSKSELEEKLKPFLFDNERYPFFEPKEEEDCDQIEQPDNLHKLPKNWYGLRPYEHKGEYIFWFVRYLTNQEPQMLNKIKQTTDFMEAYSASKKLWQKKKQIRESYDSEMYSRYQSEVFSMRSRSVSMHSDPQRRERSRQRNGMDRKKMVSQKFSNSNVNQDINSNQNTNKYSNQNSVINLDVISDLNQSQEMSFVYNPMLNPYLELDLKKKSDMIIGMFESMTISDPMNGLNNVQKSVDSFDDDMELITKPYDNKGVENAFYFEKRDKISELTQLKPNETFKYSEYVEKVLEAEEENKARRIVSVICID